MRELHVVIEEPNINYVRKFWENYPLFQGEKECWSSGIDGMASKA